MGIIRIERVRAGGPEIACRRAGSGPPMVLVHGAVADGRSWTPQLESLSDAYAVVAWDEPGAGGSDDVPDGFGLADYADCLARVIGWAGSSPAHVVGHSWGSTVALELYRRHPDRVASLVLAGAYAGWKGSLPASEVAARRGAVRRMLDGGPDAFALTVPGLFAEGPPPRYRSLLAAMAADVRAHSVHVCVEIMADTDLSDLLPHVAVPTLLLWGKQDARSPLAVAHEFERSVPGASLVILEGCGHMANLERPADFDSAVRAFCRQVDDGSADR